MNDRTLCESNEESVNRHNFVFRLTITIGLGTPTRQGAGFRALTRNLVTPFAEQKITTRKPPSKLFMESAHHTGKVSRRHNARYSRFYNPRHPRTKVL